MTWHQVFRRWLAERPALDRIEFAVVSPGPHKHMATEREYTGPIGVVTRATKEKA